MLTNQDLNKIEFKLLEKGIEDSIRSEIRKSKIIIIDDKIEDLKSIVDALNREGFNNLQKKKICPPVNDLLNANYDLIILDLNDVATELSNSDGLGILELIKESRPFQPILVVTGQKIDAEKSSIISKADLVSKKPVKGSDLANDVERVLISTKERFWASLSILRELNNIDIEIKKKLSTIDKLRLWYNRKQLEKRLENNDDKVLNNIENISKIVKHLSTITAKIVYLYKAISAN